PPASLRRAKARSGRHDPARPPERRLRVGARGDRFRAPGLAGRRARQPRRARRRALPVPPHRHRGLTPGRGPVARRTTTPHTSNRRDQRLDACNFLGFDRPRTCRVTIRSKQEALRGTAARKVRRTSLLLWAGMTFLGSAAELLYRPFHGPLLAVRLL